MKTPDTTTTHTDWNTVNDTFTEQCPKIDTTAGSVRGRWREGPKGRSAAFLGIPFAEAPVGRLRFAAPVPKAPWRGILDAAEFGATPQRGDQGITLIPEPSIPGDNTLNLNVFTPTPAASGTGLPVLVWIHGGGYVSGSAASPWYDGRAFARDGVVTVTISYRLGFDGFGWIEGAPSNRGVRDWLLALEWVRREIAAFGGNPEQVTIAGQSAGGGAVLTLLGMPSAQDLFHRAYAISGALADIPLDKAKQLGRSLAATARVEPTRVGWSSVSEEQILALQKKATAMDPASMGSIVDEGLPLGPVIDGELLPRSTRESLRLGIGENKPLVLGTTDDEFTMATADAGRLLHWTPTLLLLKQLGIPRSARHAYLRANADIIALGKARLAGRVLTDRMFRAPLLHVLADRGTAPNWAYRFSWPSGTFGFAEHCLDVPFFFDSLDGPHIQPLAGDSPPQELADSVHSAAVDFVVKGDPGWPQYDDRTHVARIFDLPLRNTADAYASVRPLVG